MTSSWNKKVWDLVQNIPKGRVASYGQLANMLGAPRKARHVGYALHQTPDDLVLPWHRVINSRGEISFERSTEAHMLQRAMLEAEAVNFSEKGRVDMKKYGWRPS